MTARPWFGRAYGSQCAHKLGKKLLDAGVTDVDTLSAVFEVAVRRGKLLQV